MATPVAPVQGTNIVVATAGVAVQAIPAAPNGGIITNPISGTDQGIGGDPEPLYVNPISNATQQGNGTTFRIEPGQSWTVIPGQTTATTVNAVTNGHKFSAIYW